MAFNLLLLLDHSIRAIRKFAEQHPDEHFYAFAIDASLLCLNSEEEFAKRLKSHRARDERRRRMITDLHEITAEDIQDFLYDMKCDRSLDISNLDERGKFAFKKHQSLFPYYSKQEPSYQSPDEVEILRCSTGDWAYQGFAELNEENGFDDVAYDIHYYRDGGGIEDEDDLSKQVPSAYTVAMNELIERIRNSGVLNALKLTGDFKMTLERHNY